MSKNKEIQAVLASSKAGILQAIGLSLIGLGVLVFLVIYHTVIIQELSFRLFPPDKNVEVSAGKKKTGQAKAITPVDEAFGIVIPKIGANARVVANVSPFNEKEYQSQLTKGVAQARGTANPGAFGNVFIFAHSAANLNLANQYNAVFYLLNKLGKDDRIYLFYKGHKYLYRVTDTSIVSSDALQYLKQDNTSKDLTLMTCWPPGTTFRRLIVRAKLTEN